MKYVIFDLLGSQPTGKTKFHGGGEYIKTVFEYYLRKVDFSNITLEVCFNNNAFIDDWILNIINENDIKINQVETYEDIIKILWQYENETEVRFFSGLPYSYWKFNFPQNVVSIGTFHGLRAIEKPYDKYRIKYIRRRRIIGRLKIKLFQKKYYKQICHTFRLGLSKFNIVITDSLHSLYSMKLNFPDLTENRKIHVFYPLTQPLHGKLYKGDFSDKGYIMLISANRWEKNSYRTSIALDGLYSKGFLKGIKTRIYGNLPNQIRKEIKNKEMFEFFDYVTTEELENAYKHCNLLIFSTLNEGFGDIPMEAMKYGKTCLVSAVCSLPEIYKDSVYYCNPYDQMEMQNMILQGIENKIPSNTIKNRVNILQERLEDDLDTLVKIISGEE